MSQRSFAGQEIVSLDTYSSCIPVNFSDSMPDAIDAHLWKIASTIRLSIQLYKSIL